MSEISDAASVRLILADFINVDAAGKVNVVGGGLSVIAGQPSPPMASPDSIPTVPFAVFGVVSVPPQFYNTQAAVELILEDSKGNPVPVPDPDGNISPLRVAQNVTFEEPQFPPGSAVPRGVLPTKIQMVLNFAAGLPLNRGEVYHWRIKVDHHTDESWTEPFFVSPAPSPIVVG